ncbi:MAG: trimethylamine methyltransferase [Actinomycetia bacterium]|nr:trimethylamine methyltransferase [Actinomycetes bacterium]MCP4962481.1 trimethylamine methyltransferase [Actinomycetes bacterium]
MNRRGRARESKRQQRLAGGRAAHPPIGPGLTGGTYRPLSCDDVDRLHDAALTVLEDLGMADAPQFLVESATARGAVHGSDGRLRFPRSLVGEIIEGAARRFVLYGRRSHHDLEISGQRVHYGTGGAAISILEIGTTNFRPSLLTDLYDFARVADQLPNVHWFTRCLIATDLPDPLDLDINTAYALVAGTTKHVGTAITVPENVTPVIELFDLAAGGTGAFAERPFCKLHSSPIVPPLRYGGDACDTLREAVRQGMPITAITAGQAGATSPASLAGTLVQTHAETLAALILVNLIEPGHPMIFSNWPFVSDLRTGSMVGGSPENAVLNAAAGQLAAHLGLPSGVAAGMADSKLPDVQAGYEKGVTTTLAGLAGANLIYESAGMLASLLAASLEQFVIDDELLGTALRTIRGIEVTDETIGLEAISEAVLGPGHYLGSAQTLALMETEYLYPALGDRRTPDEWTRSGSHDARHVAGEHIDELLANPAEHLDPDNDAAIRERFDIRLAHL